MTEKAFITSYVVDEDILVIKLHGDLDAATSTEFDNEVDEHLENGQTKIIIDCAFLGFMSSLGIASLVNLRNKLRTRGGNVKLAAIQGPVMDVLRAVRLDKVFDMHGDIEFARKSFYN